MRIPRPGRPAAARVARLLPGAPRLLAAALVLAAGVAGSTSWAQGPGPVGVLEAEAADPQPRVRATELARVLGVEATGAGDTLVLRGRDAILTAFAGSPDVLLTGVEAQETALSAPAERRADGWWLPLDAGAPFGLVRTGADTVRDGAGRDWILSVRAPREVASPGSVRASVLRPAPGAVAVELRSEESGPDGAERAAWLADLALLPLLAPEAREAVDAALAEAGAARALLLVVTSLRSGARAEGVVVTADGRELLAAGERHATLAGDPDAIGPGEPWIAVVWLPAGTRLDRPLVVAWEGARAEVTFRR
jgi:hypothetical protein